MVVRVFLASITPNTEVKKRTQRILMVLEGKHIEHEQIDITDPSHADDRAFLRDNCKAKSDQRFPLPPQIFNDEEYCGDFDDFDNAAEIDQLLEFLKLQSTTHNPVTPEVPESIENGHQIVSEPETNDDKVEEDQAEDDTENRLTGGGESSTADEEQEMNDAEKDNENDENENVVDKHDEDGAGMTENTDRDDDIEDGDNDNNSNEDDAKNDDDKEDVTDKHSDNNDVIPVSDDVINTDEVEVSGDEADEVDN